MIGVRHVYVAQRTVAAVDAARGSCSLVDAQPCTVAGLLLRRSDGWIKRRGARVSPYMRKHKADCPLTQRPRTHAFASDVREVMSDRGYACEIWPSNAALQARKRTRPLTKQLKHILLRCATGNRTPFRAVRLLPTQCDHALGKRDLPRSYQPSASARLDSYLFLVEGGTAGSTPGC